MKRRDTFQISLFAILLGIQFLACKTDKAEALENLEVTDTMVTTASADTPIYQAPYQPPEGWTELNRELGFMVDIRYATDSNFTGKVIYDCPKCLLRKDVADYLIMLQKHLKEKYNLGIKVYDCYRPRPYQQRLWDVVPDARYVTPPYKGSMHSRGMAVDLTLVDSLGNELDMGTAYDYFGREAHIDFRNLPEEVLENRSFLKAKMEEYGFEAISTEWWHFAFKKRMYDFDDFVWTCE